jgi:hypothetical protein
VIWLPAAFAVAIAANVRMNRGRPEASGAKPARQFDIQPAAQPFHWTA